jgi:hypothetical protein
MVTAISQTVIQHRRRASNRGGEGRKGKREEVGFLLSRGS